MRSEIWYAALCLLADFSPPTYWRMSNGAEFWWTLRDRSQLLEASFVDEPFAFSEIVSIRVFDKIRANQEVLSCNWAVLKERLVNIPGLRVVTLNDICIPPASRPNMVLELRVDSTG
jgi:hypothetical protein